MRLGAMFSVQQVPITSLTPYSTMESSPALKIMQMLGLEKSNFSFPDPRHGSSLNLLTSISPKRRVL